MKYVFNDGGRSAAGFKGTAGDCVCRAIAIATGKPYKEVYDDINAAAANERTGKLKKGKSSARNGVYKQTYKKLLKQYGWEWIPTMQIGQGCKVHLCEDELPKGTIIVSIAGHLTTVIDGVINDTYDCSVKKYRDFETGEIVENERRCVYGYFIKAK